MSINKVGGVNSVYGNSQIESKRPVQASSGVRTSKDQVTISQEALDFQTVLKAVKLMKNLPDIREDVVSSLKEKVDAGSYSVDSKKLAEKMLSVKVRFNE